MRWRPPASGRWGWGSPISARRWCCGTAAPSRPVAPAIVWQDRRTSDRCRELRETGVEAVLRRRTGLVADPYFSATKLEWLLRDPELRRRAGRGRARRGDGGKLAGGAAHRRAGSRERSHQREPHAPLRSRLARLAPGAARHFRGTAGSAAGHHFVLGLRGRHRPCTLGVRPADRRARGGPAVGAVRAGLLRPRGWRRTPTAPARSCWCIAAPVCRSRPAACSRRRHAVRVASRPSRSKGACSSRAPRSSGCEMVSGSSRARPRAIGWREASRARREWRSCPRSSAWARRTGRRRRVGPSSGSPAAARARTWCARRWRRSHSAAPTCCTP